MKDFEKAYNEFLKKYKKQPWYEGSLLCGSYATGNNNEHSDIDIFIITNNNIDWRERGNLLVNGFMIEYFINPIYQIEKYIASEKTTLAKHTSNMFNQGIIIDDKRGNVLKLKELAKESLFSLGEISEYQYLINCYQVWERFDELESKFINNEDIDLSYYFFLQCSIETISYNKQIGSFNINKLEKFLVDKNFRTRYGVNKFFNQKEINLLKNCLTDKERNNKYNNAKKLYSYICNEFNFDINKFSYKSKI